MVGRRVFYNEVQLNRNAMDRVTHFSARCNRERNWRLFVVTLHGQDITFHVYLQHGPRPCAKLYEHTDLAKLEVDDNLVVKVNANHVFSPARAYIQLHPNPQSHSKTNTFVLLRGR
jgi:hypothetical protein